MEQSVDTSATASVSTESTQTQESTAGYQSPSGQQDSTTQTQAQPSYVAKDEFVNQYRAIQSHVDKRYGDLNTQVSQVGQQLKALEPLINAFSQAGQQQQVDPIRQQVLSNPLNAVVDLQYKLAEYDKKYQSLEQNFSQMQQAYQGSLMEARITDAHKDRFSALPPQEAKQNLERAKTLSVTRDAPLFRGLIERNLASMGESQDYAKASIDAFGQYLDLLQSGRLNTGTTDDAALMNALNQAKLRKEKAMEAGFNGAGASQTPNTGGRIRPMESFTF
jgi:predicted RNase H-like nuclease (RuvC/YqgF family)